MIRPPDSRYDTYARFRITQRVMETYARFGTWESMSNAIHDFSGIEFPRTYFNRLRKGKLGDASLDHLVRWLASLDADFPLQLRPETIFSEVGASARDYYFHLFGMENLETWDEELLSEFEGVYLCAPEGDPHSFLPLPYVRACIDKEIDIPRDWLTSRTMDIKPYIAQRSFLILKRTDTYYYQAAEIAYGMLFPREVETLDIKVCYEGVGIASANSIHVFLRDCLSRVPKLHSILIRPKTSYRTTRMNGAQFYAPTNIRSLKEEYASLTPGQVAHMLEEYKEHLDSDVFLHGTSQVNLSPLPFQQNRVATVFGAAQVYFPQAAQLFARPQNSFPHARHSHRPPA